jgi:hypothetical protein
MDHDMTRRRDETVRRILLLPLLAGLAACASLPDVAYSASDGPDTSWRPKTSFKHPASYADAIQVWKTPEDINDWIGTRFEYDTARAMSLTETRRNQSGRLPIVPPQDLFVVPLGVCVDLSRFAVETLRAIDPGTKPEYLMIEFAPVTIAGNTFRFHWLASFKRDGRYYFFADSKRPGQIAGPYESAREFVDEYATYRGREVIAFHELDSYRRKQRTMAAKQSHERP